MPRYDLPRGLSGIAGLIVLAIMAFVVIGLLLMIGVFNPNPIAGLDYDAVGTSQAKRSL
jgi:hypothetical protein